MECGLSCGWFSPFFPTSNSHIHICRCVFVTIEPALRILSQGLRGIKRPSITFDPERVARVQLEWCNWEGEKPRVADPNSSVEMVSCGSAHASPGQVLFPDPQRFVAGQIYRLLGSVGLPPRWVS